MFITRTQKDLFYQPDRSARWRKVRFAAIERAAGICEACHVQPATQVHHLSYESYGWERLGDLMAVCDECHTRIHYPEAANDNDPAEAPEFDFAREASG